MSGSPATSARASPSKPTPERSALVALGVSVLLLIATGLAVALLALTPSLGDLGTPWRSAALLVLVVASLVAVAGPGFVVASLIPDRIAGGALRPAIAVVASAAVGWLLFWMWFAAPALGAAVSVAVLLATLAGLVVRRRSLVSGDLGRPFAVTLAVTLLVAAIALDRGGFGEGGLTVALRYWVSVDDVIPKLFADALMTGRQAVPDFLPGWASSDRPPLQTGMMMPLYSLVAAPNRAAAYLPLGLAANSAWIPAVWSLLRVLRIGERRILVVVVAVVLAGGVFLNFVYVWPKLLAAALVIAAFAVVLDRSTPRLWAALLAASAAALALFAHGASAFGLLGIVPFVVVAVRRWRWRAVLAGTGLAALLYVPWLAYQQFFDPPADRLTKWHLAGVIPPTDDSFLHVFVRAYAEAGPLGVLQNKLANLQVILGSPTVWDRFKNADSDSPWVLGPIGFARTLQSHSMLLALGVLVLGLALLVVPRVRRGRWARPLGLAVLLTAGVFAVLEFGSPDEALAWLHHGPYSLLVLAAVLGALGVTALPRVAAAVVLAVHAAVFVVLWVVTVTKESALGGDPGRWEIGMIALAVVAVAALVALAVSAKPTDQPVPA